MTSSKEGSQVISEICDKLIRFHHLESLMHQNAPDIKVMYDMTIEILNGYKKMVQILCLEEDNSK